MNLEPRTAKIIAVKILKKCPAYPGHFFVFLLLLLEFFFQKHMKKEPSKKISLLFEQLLLIDKGIHFKEFPLSGCFLCTR